MGKGFQKKQANMHAKHENIIVTATQIVSSKKNQLQMTEF